MTKSMQPELLLDLSAVFRRHRWKMRFAFLAVFALVCAYALVTSKKYTSEAKLFVRLGRETVGLDPTATTGEVVSIQDSREHELRSVEQLLKSQVVMSGAVERLGHKVVLQEDGQASSGAISQWVNYVKGKIESVNPFYVDSPRDKAVLLLQKHSHVDLPEHSQVVTVSYTDKSPARAQETLQAIIDCARDAHVRVNQTNGSYDFFAKQKEDNIQQVESLEKELLEFKNRTGIAELPRQREHLVDRIANLETSLLDTESALQSAISELSIQESELKSRPKEHRISETKGMPQSSSQVMRQQLYALELEEKKLASLYSDGNPKLDGVREQIISARKTLDKEETLVSATHGVDTSWQHLERVVMDNRALMKSLESRKVQMALQIESEKKKLEGLNNNEIALSYLERKLALATDNYSEYARKYEQARIYRALSSENISNINILQPPSTSLLPSSPQPLLFIAIGLVLGIFAAVSTAFYFEFHDQSQMSMQESESKPSTLSVISPNRQDSPGLVASTSRVEQMLVITAQAQD